MSPKEYLEEVRVRLIHKLELEAGEDDAEGIGLILLDVFEAGFYAGVNTSAKAVKESGADLVYQRLAEFVSGIRFVRKAV